MCKRLLLFLAIAITIRGGLSVRGADQPAQQNTKAAETPAALLEALKDKDAGVRLQAAQLLTQMGEDKPAVYTLVELLKVPEQTIRPAGPQNAQADGAGTGEGCSPGSHRVTEGR